MTCCFPSSTPAFLSPRALAYACQFLYKREHGVVDVNSREAFLWLEANQGVCDAYKKEMHERHGGSLEDAVFMEIDLQHQEWERGQYEFYQELYEVAIEELKRPVLDITYAKLLLMEKTDGKEGMERYKGIL